MPAAARRLAPQAQCRLAPRFSAGWRNRQFMQSPVGTALMPLTFLQKEWRRHKPGATAANVRLLPPFRQGRGLSQSNSDELPTRLPRRGLEGGRRTAREHPSGSKPGRMLIGVSWIRARPRLNDSCGIRSPAPHDLRRACARPCRQAGGELEKIQFLLGRVSVQMTQRYLGCKQRFRNAVNNRIELEPDSLEAPLVSVCRMA